MQRKQAERGEEDHENKGRKKDSKTAARLMITGRKGEKKKNVRETDKHTQTYLILFPDSNGIHPLVPVPTHDIAQVLQPLDLLALPPHLASTGNAHVLLSVLGDGFTL